MKIEFTGTYKNKVVEKEPLYLNTITIKRNDGEIVIIDRDETNYTIKDGEIDILFRGSYEWNGEESIYLKNEDIDLYNNALIVGYEIEDDTPEGYDLIIEEQNISAW